MLLARSSVSSGKKFFSSASAFLSFRLHRDPRILELLYEEARHNVLLGRYIMEPAHSIMLGGIQARIELGPYNVHTHTVSYFR
jgi:FERM central domain